MNLYLIFRFIRLAMTTSDSSPHWFWAESVWLPPNMSWAEVRPRPGSSRYTRFEQLWYPVPAGILLIFVRGYVMKYVRTLYIVFYRKHYRAYLRLKKV